MRSGDSTEGRWKQSGRAGDRQGGALGERCTRRAVHKESGAGVHVCRTVDLNIPSLATASVAKRDGNPARNHSVVKSDVGSRWMAFVKKQTKTNTYPFVMRQDLPV